MRDLGVTRLRDWCRTRLIREIVESGILDEVVAGRIEDQLHQLAAQGEVAYNRSGDGWHLTGTEVADP